MMRRATPERTPVERFRGAVVRWVFRCLCRGVLAIGRFLYNLEIHGSEHLDTTGPFILTFRHVSGMDLFFVALTLTLKEPPLGMTGVVTVNRFRAWLGQYLGMLPLFKEQGLSAVSLMTLSKALQQRRSIQIADNEIPWDGRPQPPRSGVAWCALHSGAPVVVAVVNGGYRIAPRWAQRLPLRGKLV